MIVLPEAVSSALVCTIEQTNLLLVTFCAYAEVKEIDSRLVR
jgi:hypothetical protein